MIIDKKYWGRTASRCLLSKFSKPSISSHRFAIWPASKASFQLPQPPVFYWFSLYFQLFAISLWKTGNRFQVGYFYLAEYSSFVVLRSVRVRGLTMELTVHNTATGASAARRSSQLAAETEPAEDPETLPRSNRTKIQTSVSFLAEILFFANVSEWTGYILISFMSWFC